MSEKAPMSTKKKIIIFIVLVVVALLLSYGVAMVITAIRQQTGEETSQTSSWNVPKRDVHYTKDNLEAKNFTCELSYSTDVFKKTKKYTGDTAIDLYNCMNIINWEPVDYHDIMPSDVSAGDTSDTSISDEDKRVVVSLLFYDGDESKPENCYGQFYVNNEDYVISTTYSLDMNFNSYQAKDGTYDYIMKYIKAL